MKYRIASQLSEKQMEKDFSNFMGFISALSDRQFRLIDVNEQETGSDALLKIGDGILPMYIQFKVSDGIEIADRTIPNRFTIIKSIHDFRTSEKLTDDPILNFKLRDKADRADEFQHNVLYRHNTPKSFAFYLAPLTLNRDSFYESLVSNPDFFYWHYWREIRRPSFRQVIQMTPGFKNCATITPHATVDSSDHYYSYSLTGGNICFHEPELVQREVSRLSDNFYSYLTRARESGYESYSEIEEIHMNTVYRETDGISRQSYKSYCKDLYDIYRIRTYLLVGNPYGD